MALRVRLRGLNSHGVTTVVTRLSSHDTHDLNFILFRVVNYVDVDVIRTEAKAVQILKQNELECPRAADAIL